METIHYSAGDIEVVFVGSRKKVGYYHPHRTNAWQWFTDNLDHQEEAKRLVSVYLAEIDSNRGEE